MTCYYNHSRQRNRASGQSLRLQWRTFAADNGGALQSSNRRNDVPYRLVHSWPSRLPWFVAISLIQQACLSATSVLTPIGSLIKRFAAKKAGVEDGEINNQRKDVPRYMLAWSRELITDVRKPKRKSWLWRHCRAESYLLITPITLASMR